MKSKKIYLHIISLGAIIFLTACATGTKQGAINPQYVYVSSAKEVTGIFLGKLVIAQGQQCCLKNDDPHDLTVRQRTVNFKAIVLDRPIDTTSNSVVGEPGYMPPEKNVNLLELAFISGSNAMEIFDQNIGKKARLTCELRHLHPLSTWGMTKVNCSVLKIEPEPWWGFF